MRRVRGDDKGSYLQDEQNYRYQHSKCARVYYDAGDTKQCSSGASGARPLEHDLWGIGDDRHQNMLMDQGCGHVNPIQHSDSYELNPVYICDSRMQLEQSCHYQGSKCTGVYYDSEDAEHDSAGMMRLSEHAAGVVGGERHTDMLMGRDFINRMQHCNPYHRRRLNEGYAHDNKIQHLQMMADGGLDIETVLAMQQVLDEDEIVVAAANALAEERIPSMATVTTHHTMSCTEVEDDDSDAIITSPDDAISECLASYVENTPDVSVHEALLGGNSNFYEVLPAVMTHNCVPITKDLMENIIADNRAWVDRNKHSLPLMDSDLLLAVRLLVVSAPIPFLEFINAPFEGRQESTDLIPVRTIENIAPFLKLAKKALTALGQVCSFHTQPVVRALSLSDEAKEKVVRLTRSHSQFISNGLYTMHPYPHQFTPTSLQNKTILIMTNCQCVNVSAFQKGLSTKHNIKGTLLLLPLQRYSVKSVKPCKFQRSAIVIEALKEPGGTPVISGNTHDSQKGIESIPSPSKVGPNVIEEGSERPAFNHADENIVLGQDKSVRTEPAETRLATLHDLENAFWSIFCGEKRFLLALVNLIERREEPINVITVAEAILAICLTNEKVVLVPTDVPMANKLGAQCSALLHSQAHQQCRYSQYFLSQFYFLGIAVPRNEKKGMEFCSLSADLGFAPALYKCAVRKGKSDMAGSLRMYQAAADKGFPLALFTLAEFLETGKHGMPQNKARAFLFYARAAEARYPKALKKMGDAYFYGQNPYWGVDKVKAEGFYRLAGGEESRKSEEVVSGTAASELSPGRKQQ
jgi:hypothetical protein